MCVPTFVFLEELEVRQKREQIPAGTMLLAVEDPQTRVGSGGATLNALLVAAEHLSARAGFTVSASQLLPLWTVFPSELKSFLPDPPGGGGCSVSVTGSFLLPPPALRRLSCS